MIASRSDLRRWTIRWTTVHVFVVALAIGLQWSLSGALTGTDAALYLDYASKTLAGAVAYRDFPVVYPPLTLPLFVLPRLFTGQPGLYYALFGLEMLLWDALLLSAVARRVSEQAGPSQVPVRLGWYTLFITALYPFIATRYDLVPATVAFLAAYWWFSGRQRLGGAMAALGLLLKIFPGVVAAVGLLWDASRSGPARWRGLGAFVLTLAGGVGIWAWLGMGSTLTYHLQRGLEIESVPAGLLMAFAKMTGGALQWAFDHGSFRLVSQWAAPAAALTLPVQVAAVLLVLWRFARGGLQDPLRCAGAAILAFTIPAKVLSPQYLLWFIPFVTTLEGRSGAPARWLFLLACIVTTLVYPWALPGLLNFDPAVIGLLNVRNALLVALLAVWVFGEFAVPTSARPAPAAREARPSNA